MLYIKEPTGVCRPAPARTVMREANRLCDGRLRSETLILSSYDAQSAIGYRLRNKQHEVFACLFLDSTHRVLAFKEMFRGSINRATVHPREVVKKALQFNAAAIIFAHNHPSGDTQPSRQDIELTDTLKNILQVIDVRVLDHLVVGDEVYSFADNGKLNDNLYRR